jgi:acyl-coenzyme A synthetase/AMP-(fatty) acid ligase
VTGHLPRGLPLVDRQCSAPVAWHENRFIGAAEFLSCANGLATRLPDHSAAINLCENRYRFLVGFAATLIRGAPTLLPSSDTCAARAELQRRYPGCITISDVDVDPSLHGAVENPQLAPDACAAILFTSGSTGVPVAQAKTWEVLCAGARKNNRYYFDLPPRAWSVVATVPAQHMYGMETSIMSVLQGDVTLHDGRPFFPADVQRALQQMPEPRLLVSSPVHLRALVRSGLRYPAVTRVLSATAPLDESLAQQVERVFQCELIEIYGATEIGSMAWRRAASSSAWRFFDGFSADVSQDAVRVIADHLPAPVPLPDVLDFGPDGDFRLVGRTGDLVKVGGKRTTLSAIARCLTDIPGVEDALAFRAEAEGEEGVATARIAALVVSPSLAVDAIRLALRGKLDPIFIPRQIHLVSALPRNATGKITRREVSDMLMQLGIEGGGG